MNPRLSQPDPATRPIRRAAVPALATILLLTAAAVGCGPSDPQERVAKLRAEYSAELNSFVIEETPEVSLLTPVPAPLDGEEMEDASEAEEPADGEEEGADGEEMEPVPTRTDVVLDILLQSRAQEQLPGITLDFTHVDPQQVEKDRRLIWVETGNMLRGRGKQVTHTVEDIDYQEGDGFHIEVRHPIPPEERGDYAEFSEATDG